MLQLAILPNEFASFIIAWIFGIVGILANGYVIYYNTRKLAILTQGANKVHVYLIINLAMADGFGSLYLLILCIADLIYSQDGQYYTCYSNKSCYGHNNTWSVSPGCSVARFSSTVAIYLPALLTLLIAMDSYLSIIQQKYRRLLSYFRAKIVVGVLWAFVSSLGLTLVLRSYQVHNPENFRGWVNLCHTSELNDIVIRIINYFTFIIVIFPYFATVTIYAIIFDRVRRSRYNRVSVGHHIINSEKYVGLVSGIIAITNLISWFPAVLFAIGQMIEVESLKSHQGYAITGLVFLLFFINSCSNPLIYTFLTWKFCKRCT